MIGNIGVIGLGVMGRSIAQNLISKEFKTVVYNRSHVKVTSFLEKIGSDSFVKGVSDLREFVQSLETPRKILLMVSAGSAVDDILDELLALTAEGDIIIDGGNSWYLDTEKRIDIAKSKGVHFVGMGVSGGEKGALLGPSMMPGGSASAIKELMPILEPIAAKAPSPCVGYVGKGGSGHFVKMVHNGIEYAEMQFISEVHSFVTQAIGLNRDDVSSLFNKLNRGQLESYLLEITNSIIGTIDDLSESPLLEKISDRAKGKGTGRWTVESALQHGVSFSAAYAAVDARNLSSMESSREKIREIYGDSKGVLKISDIDDCISKMLIAGKIIIYSQGISLIESVSAERDYSIDIASLIRSWRGGCIIRSAILDSLAKSFESESNGLFISHPPFITSIREGVSELRKFAQASIAYGIPAPCVFSMISYFDSLRAGRLGTALIQAQRDFFGAHTYERTDRSGAFHTEWE